MGRVIISPVKKWAGSVTLADPLTFPQYIAWRNAMLAAHALSQTDNYLEYCEALLPGVVACVEKWELNGFAPPPAPYPATPRDSSDKLLGWLVREIRAVANETGEDDPK